MSAYFARPAAVAPDFYHRSGDRIVLPETAKGREPGLKLLVGLAGYSNPRTVPTKEDPVSEPAARRPVTVLAARTVQAGREREFESFLSELQDVFAGAPGISGSRSSAPNLRTANTRWSISSTANPHYWPGNVRTSARLPSPDPHHRPSTRRASAC